MASQDWIHQIETALAKSGQLSSLQEGILFPWSEAGHSVGKAINIPDLKLSPRETVLKMPTELLSGLGSNPTIITIELAPLPGALFWAMAAEDSTIFTGSALSLDAGHAFSDPKLQAGFYEFLALKAIYALNLLKVFKETSPRLSLKASLPGDSALCTDIAITLPHKTVYGRLICPPSFLSAFETHTPSHTTPLLDTEAARDAEITLTLDVGRVALKTTEWSKVAIGDFIILDHALYDPMAQKGSVSFCIGGHPVLRGRIKPEGIKILEQDVEPETSTDVLSSVPKAEQETTDHLWTSETEGVAPDPLDAPLHLSVEIGRVKMPLKKLLSLESGSILDIIPDIDQSVDLVLNGRSVAKGELLHLGHLAGVRILDLHG